MTRKGNMVPLKTLYFELTHACNQSCKFCYLDAGIHRDFYGLDTEQVKSIFREFKEKGGRYAVITGGEPMVRKDCFEILDCVDGLELPFSFASNSLLATGKKLEQLAGYHYMNLYFTSILGRNAADHKRIAGNDSYDNVFQALSYMEQKGKDTYVQVTLINEYIGYMEEIMKQLLQFPNCTVKFTPAVTAGIHAENRELKDQLVPKESLSVIHKEIKRLQEAYPGRIEDSNIQDYTELKAYMEDYQEEELYSLCYGFLALRPDGTKSFSCNLGNPFTFGNAKDGIDIPVDEKLLTYVELLKDADQYILDCAGKGVIEVDVAIDERIRNRINE